MSTHSSPSITLHARRQLRRLVLEAGACACGFAGAVPVSEKAAGQYRKWIAQGLHASMGYLEKYTDIRNDPRLLLDGARSLIVCLFPYYSTPDLQTRPHIAHYALGNDYHEVLRSVLSPVATRIEQQFGGKTRICIDTAPLRERYWANRAGLGYIGRNCQLIVPGVGSAFFISAILWTGVIPPDNPLPDDAGHICGTCKACVNACPGKALNGTGELDARKCLSFLTIENRDTLPPLTPLAGNLYGCDICRNVCPHYRSSTSVLPDFTPRPELLALDLEAWLYMTTSQFKRLTAHSAMRRTTATRLKNIAALIARESANSKI